MIKPLANFYVLSLGFGMNVAHSYQLEAFAQSTRLPHFRLSWENTLKIRLIGLEKGSKFGIKSRRVQGPPFNSKIAFYLWNRQSIFITMNF